MILARNCKRSFHLCSIIIIQKPTSPSSQSNTKSFSSRISFYDERYSSSIRNLCTAVDVRPEKRSSRSAVLTRLESALKEHRVDASITKDYFLVRKIITEMCYSSEPLWLKKACGGFARENGFASVEYADEACPFVSACSNAQACYDDLEVNAGEKKCAQFSSDECTVLDCAAFGEDRDRHSPRIEFLDFKFDDLVAASELIVQMCDDRKSLPIQRDKSSQRSYLVPIGSHNLKSGLNMQIFPELLQRDSVLKLEGKQELVIFLNGKLVLSNMALAKLITRYRKDGDSSELSELLLKIQKGLCSVRGYRLGNDVIQACIQLGILDDMEAAETPMGHNTFMSLLTAYYKGKQVPQATALLKQTRKAGYFVSLFDEMVASICLSEADTSAICASESSSTVISDLENSLVKESRDEEEISDLVNALVQETRAGKEEISSRVYQFNSSVNFFCKAKMIDDALKTYKLTKECKSWLFSPLSKLLTI